MFLSDTAPAPVDLATAKTFLQVFHDADDLLIGSLLASATSIVELETGRAILARTCSVILDCFPFRLALPFGPVASVDLVKYRDSQGQLQTLDPSAYQFDRAGRFGLTRNAPIPVVEPGTFGTVVIEYTAGDEEAPEGLKNAVLFVTRHLWETRGPVADVQFYEVPMTLSALVAPFKVHNYG